MYENYTEQPIFCPYCRFTPGGRPPFQPPIEPPQGRPPVGIPPGQPGERPPVGRPQGGPPQGPPPSFTPSEAQAQHLVGGPTIPGGPTTFAVDPGAIRRCLYRYVFIWLRGGRGFWIYLTFVGRRSIAGWRWNGRFWVYFGIDIRRIQSFYCY